MEEQNGLTVLLQTKQPSKPTFLLVGGVRLLRITTDASHRLRTLPSGFLIFIEAASCQLKSST